MARKTKRKLFEEARAEAAGESDRSDSTKVVVSAPTARVSVGQLVAKKQAVENPTRAYRCLANISAHDKNYPLGSTVHLTDKQAAPIAGSLLDLEEEERRALAVADAARRRAERISAERVAAERAGQ